MLDGLKLHFLEVRNVFGPAWLVMMADVDAASVITAMQSGASFKYGLILILIALVIPLYFIMEVAGRVGAATKKGLGELMRENFSKKLSIILSFPMAITDFLSYVGRLDSDCRKAPCSGGWGAITDAARSMSAYMGGSATQCRG